MRYFILAFVLVCVAVVGIAGFRGSHTRRPIIEIFPDMVRQAKLRPQVPNDFFADGRSSQVHPEHTVPHSKAYVINGETFEVNGQPVYPYQDSPINTGKVP